MDIPGKRWQAPFVRSTRRAVPAKGACHLFPKAVNLFLPLAFLSGRALTYLIPTRLSAIAEHLPPK